MDFTVKEISEGIQLITLSGELDMYNYNELKEYITNVTNEKNGTFIIDCKDLTYIDSSGVSTFIYAYSTAQKRRLPLWFINIHGSVQKVIELTKLNGFLPIASSLKEVLTHVKKKEVKTR